jgi:hypothetical protein
VGLDSSGSNSSLISQVNEGVAYPSYNGEPMAGIPI